MGGLRSRYLGAMSSGFCRLDQHNRRPLTWHLRAGFSMGAHLVILSVQPPKHQPTFPAMKTAAHAHTFQALRTTSALCKAAQVTRGQLRLYEEAGLIAPLSRTEAGYRQFGTDTLDRLKAIGHLKALGFTLADIGLLLAERDGGEIDAPALQRLAQGVLSKIDERMAGLRVIRAYVAPVAVGDLGALQDEDCNFVVEFMTALSAEQTRRRA